MIENDTSLHTHGRQVPEDALQHPCHAHPCTGRYGCLARQQHHSRVEVGRELALAPPIHQHSNSASVAHSTMAWEGATPLPSLNTRSALVTKRRAHRVL